MSSSRLHTDGERHDGTTPTESMIVLPLNEWSQLDETLAVLREQGLNCTGCGVALPRPGMCFKCAKVAQEKAPLFKCLVDGCDNFTAFGICPDCMDAIEQDALDQLAPKKPARLSFRQVVAIVIVVAFVVVFLGTWIALYLGGLR